MPLHVAIDMWEGGAETDKPEDLPKRALSALLSRKKHSGKRVDLTTSNGGHDRLQDAASLGLEVAALHFPSQHSSMSIPKRE